jgi:hypothetical protein
MLGKATLDISADGTILSEGKIIGAIWILGRKGVRVIIEDDEYLGRYVTDAIGNDLDGYPDLQLHWNN